MYLANNIFIFRNVIQRVYQDSLYYIIYFLLHFYALIFPKTVPYPGSSLLY